MSEKEIGFGVFGVAHHHSHPFASAVLHHSNTRLAGVYDRDKKRGKAFAAKFSIPYFENLDDLFEIVQAGIVTSENASKKSIAIALARAGKHILCDKPLGIDSKESLEIIKECKKSNVKLQVGYLSRYTPGALEAKRIISSGKIGRVKFISGENRVDAGVVKQLSGWLAFSKMNGGKGALLEHSVHVADLAQWYVESQPVSAYAVRAKNLDPSFQIEDNFSILVKYRNGSCATLDGSYCRSSSGRPGDVILEVVGEKGKVRIQVQRKALELYEGQEPHTIHSLIQTKLGDSYEGLACRNMIDDLVCCILNDKEPLTSGDDALMVNALVEASYRSLSSGEVEKV